MPQTLAPPAPFPLVTAQSIEREPVAPGVERATYRLLTTAGPLVVSVVTADPHEPTVRLGTVLARNSVRSEDETVSSMARRTHAVAGVNGDYFDIGGTGAPVGVLVRDGRLQRSPSSRVALTVTRDRNVRFEQYTLTGSVTTSQASVPITGVNVLPPEGGVSLLTRDFGAPPMVPMATFVALTEALVGTANVYRVTTVSTFGLPSAPNPFPIWLVYGPRARAFGPIPQAGDLVTVTADVNPPLATVAQAIGGGPLLLSGGVPVDDPASPNYADRGLRIPATAAGRFPDGTLALVVVDGRHPATSIGLNRAEIIALLQGLGTTDAMLFDGGGSSTLVARVLGDADASVINEPSDGIERPVADGIFVYSDAPVGPAERLIVRPRSIVAVPGASVPLQARLVDAAGHGLGDAHGAWTIDAPPDVATIDANDVLHAGAAGARTLHVTRGGVSADVPFEVVGSVARLQVLPVRVNPDPHGAVQLSLAAFDANDRPVAVDGTVRWQATGGTIDANGRLVAGDADAQVTAAAGGIETTVRIPVGKREGRLALFEGAHATGWKFSSVPANGPGSASVDVGGRLAIAYGGGNERAAYATPASDVPLGDPLAILCTVDGYGNAVSLRATFVDRYGDRQTAAFTHTFGAAPAYRVALIVPSALAPPIALHAFSVIATGSVLSAGTTGIRDCSESLPGAQIP